MFYEKLKKFLASNKFLIFIFVWFIFSSGWIMASLRFNAPHDEAMHYKAIQVYSDRLSPNIALEDLGSENLQLAMNTYSPSFLYHYLLSFPYRVADSFTNSDYVRHFTLRVITLLISIAGLYVLFRTLRVIFPKSKATVNLILFTFTSTTIYSYIAGGVNYDNLQLLFVFSMYYFFAKMFKKPELRTLFMLVAVALLATATKFTSVIIVIPVLVFTFYLVIKNWKKLKMTATNVSRNKLSVVALVFLFMSTVVALYRPLGNIIQYGSLQPKCKKVYTQEICLENGIIARNERTREAHKDIDRANLYSFTSGFWASQMRTTTYGVYNSSTSSDDTALIRILVGSLIVAVPLLAYPTVRGFKFNVKTALYVTSLFYVAMLLYKNYTDYLDIGLPFAVQGRYLLPILPIIYMFGFEVIRNAIKSRKIRTALVLVALICFSTSGWITFLQLTDNTWYVKNESVRSVNESTKGFVEPLDFLIISEKENQ